MTAARVKLTPEQGIECARLYVAGETLAQIARVMSASREQVRMVLRRAGIRRRPPGRRPGRSTTPKGNR